MALPKTITTTDYEKTITKHALSSEFAHLNNIPVDVKAVDWSNEWAEYTADVQAYAWEGARVSAEGFADNALAVYLQDDPETAIVNALQEDVHEMFPNEKMWPHLDDIAKRVALSLLDDILADLRTIAEDFIYS